MKRRILLLNGLTTTLLFGGCMGYRLGGSRPEGIETVHLKAVLNRTQEPAIETSVSQALRERIQFDGRLKLRNKSENADALIEVTLTNYRLSPTAFRRDNNTAAKQYRLRINATAKLIETGTGRILREASNHGENIFAFESDLTTSKRNALEPAAQELAKLLIDDLVEQW